LSSEIDYSFALEIDTSRIRHVLNKIAKGLYYIDVGKPLPDFVNIQFKYAGNQPQILIEPPLDEPIKEAKKSVLGDNVVVYWRNTIKNNPANSMTWLVFNHFHSFLILTYMDHMI
jgi:hypothetical protein